MALETLYLFLALAILTALGAWLNVKAGITFLKVFTLAVVLIGTVGMLYLVGAALLG